MSTARITRRPTGLLLTALLAVLGALVAPAGALAASDAVWSQTGSRLTRGPALVAPNPRESAAFRLRPVALRPRLDAAPRERARGTRGSLPILAIPAPDGSLKRFRIAESPVMEPGLAAKVPEFTSYTAIGIDDPNATARLDFSPLGFHATVRGAEGGWFVDPVDPLDPERHIAYRGTLREGTGLREPVGEPAATPPPVASRPAPGGLVQRRTYRLALSSDPTYAEEFGAANVDIEKATLVNRANQLYNDDLAIQMVLIDRNDELNYDTADKFALGGGVGAGYLTADCTNATLLANQRATDAAVGAASYDIGHLISASPGGGLAGLRVAGRDGEKAEGCTGAPNPRGDGFAIDYFAHEVGHQFGGNHTFNGTTKNCGGGNRNAATAVEPGSGSSVMAYAGICDADNLQRNSDPWFSQRSIAEIQAYVVSNQGAGARNGGTAAATANHAPVVSAPAGRTIPPRTPFVLAGSATDPDAGNALVYLWEQNDTGAGAILTSNAKPSGALFRQFGTAAVEDATTSPAPGQNLAVVADSTRTFPDIAQVLAGNTNAASGSCPAASSPPTAAQIECFSEYLPTSARTLHFRLTARDQVLGGGGESSADTLIAVSGSTPFRVTSQVAADTASGGSTVAVTWNVAGTAASPVLAASVRILYSTDGGLTFPTVLAARTANDGSRTVSIPNAPTTRGRIKVEALGNYFFDVSHADLTVTPGSAPGPDPDPDPAASAPDPEPPPPDPGTDATEVGPKADPGQTPVSDAATTTPAPDVGSGEASTEGPIRLPPVDSSATPSGEAAKFPAKIRVLRAGIVDRRLDVLAEVTKRASGRVRVSYRSGGVTSRFSAPVENGRIRFKQRLSGRNAAKTTGIFSLAYAGDDDVRADGVKLRAANVRARLRPGAAGIARGSLGITGTISKRARGVMRIRLEYLDGAALERRDFKVPIVDGTWSLFGPLPPAAATDGVQLSIQYTGSERARIRGEQTSKRVRPG